MSPVAIAVASPTLLDQLGGRPGVQRIVDRFVAKILTDNELAARFAGVGMATLETSLAAFLIEAFGGGAASTVNQGLVRLDGEQFVRVLVHLYDALADRGLSKPLTEQLVLALASRILSADASSAIGS
jgi:truncated hemoglobin YjbI